MEAEKRVIVPRPSYGKRVVSSLLLLVSAGLLVYAWWAWRHL